MVSRSKEVKMFNDYLAQQEKYRDLLREAEKERLVRLVLESQKKDREESSLSSELNSQGWLQKLGLLFRDAGSLAGR
jgi:hypothetical protein